MRLMTLRNRERIKIGPDITITVLETNGLQTRLGVEAPRNVLVLRGEVHERAKQATQKGRRGT
jgi:carbon storage regulator